MLYVRLMVAVVSIRVRVEVRAFCSPRSTLFISFFASRWCGSVGAYLARNMLVSR